MPQLRRFLPSPAGIISMIALFAALGGTGYAASRIASPKASAAKLTKKKVRKIADAEIKSKAPAIADTEITSKAGSLSVANATNAQNATNANNAATANNANNLGGQPPSAFVSSSKIVRFSDKVGFGTTTTLFSAGVFTFSLKCVQNGTDPSGAGGRSYAAIEIATSQNGAYFYASGEPGGVNGTASSSGVFNTTTPENGRIWQLESIGAGGSQYSASFDGGTALAPDGTAVSFSNEGTGLGVNVLGAGCVGHGFAVIDN